jgi:hypothetical protein
MATKETIEKYLMSFSEPFEEIGDGMWVIRDDFDNIDDIVVWFDEPLIVFRVKLFDIPEGNNEKLYRFMLEKNSLLTHGAYAIEGNSVVIVDTLETENLDYNEFEGSVNSLAMAIVEHYPEFKETFNI